MYMHLLNHCFKQFNTISIVGVAKNAGKTTTLNYLLEVAAQENVVIGLTSTGRDGELQDVVTSTEKPAIYVSEGMIVSTASKIFDQGDAGLEILNATNYGTPLGDIIICRVKESGTVQIAGPTNAVDIKKISEEMLNYGVATVLIDGSIDRKSSASPLISEATILATGAALSRDINIVVQETAYISELYRLPKLEDKMAYDIIATHKGEKPLLIDREYQVLELNIATGISNSRHINERITDDIQYIYFPGALTNSALADIEVNKLKAMKIIIKDGTKIFVDANRWQSLQRHGLKVEVLHPINLIAITLNPYSPKGYYFNPNVFMEKMKKRIEGLEMFDIYNGGGNQ